MTTPNETGTETLKVVKGGGHARLSECPLDAPGARCPFFARIDFRLRAPWQKVTKGAFGL
eukprot:2160915-Heterocapsa_arctica.AAC.1